MSRACAAGRREAAGRQILAVPAERVVWRREPWGQHDGGQLEPAVDLGVPVVVELEVEGMVARHVVELDEAELGDRGGEREPEPLVLELQWPAPGREARA